MASYTLDQGVKHGDLILVYHPEKVPNMLLVKSIIENNDAKTSKSASSIMVQRVNLHIPDQKGYWAMSGPEVYYVDESEDADHMFCMYDQHYEEGDYSETTFSKFLSRFGFTAADDDGKYPDTVVIVNPHGRDVIKHHFNGICPHCGSSGWFCPGCGGVSRRYPDLFGSCGLDQSCPVCLGYEFALNGKSDLDYTDKLEYRVQRYKPHEEEYDKAKEELLAFHKQRYEGINSHKEEMSLPVEDVEKLQEEYYGMKFGKNVEV